MKISRSRSPGCVVRVGQSGMTTLPPVTSAAARNGWALDRSGSTVRSRPSSAPGVTRQTFGSPPDSGVSTWAPTARSMSTVIRMCGIDGSAEPVWRTSTPWLKRGPDSSRALTNWDDDEASISTGPPSRAPPPCTVIGSAPRASSSMRAPRARSASITPCSGRSYERGSPSKRTAPSARVATGGRKRMTVPALPTSTVAGPRRPAGMTRQNSPVPSGPTPSSISTPIARSASAISTVSRERSGRRSQPGSEARAASTRARLVTDLDPGTWTVASTAPLACGAGQRAVCAGFTVMGPTLMAERHRRS